MTPSQDQQDSSRLPRLFQLPNEILAQVASHLFDSLDSDPDSRKWTARAKLPTHTFTCQKWASIVIPVHFSRLNNKLQISGNDLTTLPAKGTRLYEFLCTEVQHLSVRLVGQPSRLTASKPFFSDPVRSDDSDSEDDASMESSSSDDSIASMTQSLTIEPAIKTFDRQAWKQKIGHSIDRLVGDESSLTEFTFEAFYGMEAESNRQWNYITNHPMAKLICQLPPTLKFLTLDLAGTDIIYEGRAGRVELRHICPHIARCLMHTEHVRLRLRHICPSIFRISSLERQNDDSKAPPFKGFMNAAYSPHKLKSLALRVCLPQFQHGGADECDSKICPQFSYGERNRASTLMPLAARHFLTLEPQIEKLGVTYRYPPEPQGIELYALDVIKWQTRTLREEVFWYEDDGEEWTAWENAPDGCMHVRSLPDPLQMAANMMAELESGTSSHRR